MSVVHLPVTSPGDVISLGNWNYGSKAQERGLLERRGREVKLERWEEEVETRGWQHILPGPPRPRALLSTSLCPSPPSQAMAPFCQLLTQTQLCPAFLSGPAESEGVSARRKQGGGRQVKEWGPRTCVLSPPGSHWLSDSGALTRLSVSWGPV